MDTLFGDVTASWVGFRISGKVRIDMDIRFDIEADNSQFELVLMLCRSGDGQKIDDAVYIPYTVTSLSQNEYRVQILLGVDLAVERWESIGLVRRTAVQTTDYTLVSSSADRENRYYSFRRGSGHRNRGLFPDHSESAGYQTDRFHQGRMFDVRPVRNARR